MVKTIDLTDMMFGNLKVINQVDDKVRKDGKREAMWICECQCEKRELRIVRGSDLKSGHSKSCGCEKIKDLISRNRKDNEFYIKEDVAYIKLSNTYENMICDYEDWVKNKDRCWSVDTTGYARATKDNKNIYMHRLIMKNGSKELFVDHINGNRLDNRKSNLRYVTPKQSMMNIHSNYSNTKVKGVYYNKKTNNYEVYIHDSGKKHLGYYKTLEEAITKREESEIKMYGEYSEILSRRK